MCLAIPGRILAISGARPLERSGECDFGGVRAQINLAFVPEARVGDFILAHVGVAIGRIDPEAAEATLAALGGDGE